MKRLGDGCFDCNNLKQSVSFGSNAFTRYTEAEKVKH